MARKQSPSNRPSYTVEAIAALIFFAACNSGFAQTEDPLAKLRADIKQLHFSEVKTAIEQRSRGKIESLSVDELNLLIVSEFFLGNYDRVIELAPRLKNTDRWRTGTDYAGDIEMFYVRSLIFRRPEEARVIVERMLQDALASENKEEIADAYLQLADVQMKLKQFSLARASSERALEHYESIQLQGTFKSIQNILRCNQLENQSSQNEKLLVDAIAKYDKESGEDSELAIQLRSELCKIFVKANRRDESDLALSKIETALKTNSSLRGYCSILLVDLANIYLKDGQIEHAKRLLDAALPLSEKYHGASQNNSIQCRETLIVCLLAMKDYDAAMQRVLETIDLVPKANKVKRASLLNQLSICLPLVKNPDETSAENGYKVAADMLEASGQKESSLKVWKNLAQFYSNQKNYQAAITTLSDTIERSERTSLKDKWFVVRCLHSRAVNYNLLKKTAAAEKDFQNAVARAATIQPLDVEAKRALLQDLSRFYLSQNRYEENSATIAQLTVLAEQNGPNNEALAFCYNQEGIGKLRQQKPAEAETCFKKSLDLYIKSGNQAAIRVAQTNIADAYRDAGKYKEEESIRRAIVESLSKSANESIEMSRALRRLAYALSYLDKQQEVLESLQRAASIAEKAKADASEQLAIQLEIATTFYELKDTVRYKSALQKLISDSEAQKMTNTETYADTLNRMGVLLYNDSQYDQAKAYYDRSLRVFEERLGASHPETLRVLQNLATCADDSGNKQEAERIQKMVLARVESRRNVTKPEIADALETMAGQLESNQEAQKEVLLKKALEYREAAPASNDLRIATTLKLIGWCFSRQNRYDEAEPFYKRAISLLESAKTSDDLLTRAQVLHSMGRVQFEKKNFEEAIKLYSQAASIRKTINADKDYDFADSLFGLATSQRRLEKLVEAETNLKQAISIFKLDAKANQSDLANAYDWLGTIYRDQKKHADSLSAYQDCLNSLKGDGPLDSVTDVAKLESIAEAFDRLECYAEAEPIRERIKSIREKARGEHDLSYIAALSELALNLRRQSKFDSAEKLYRQAVSICSRNFGEDHVNTRGYTRNLAYCLKDAAKYKEATELFKKLLPFYEVSGDSNYSDIAGALADNYWFEGKLAEADDSFRRLLATVQKKHGTDSLLYASVAMKVADFFKSNGDISEAESLLQQALMIRRKHLRVNDPYIAQTLLQLARVKRQRQDYKAAKDLIEEAKSIYSTAYGESSDVADTNSDLGDLANWQNDYPAAESHYQTALRISRLAFGEDSLKTAFHLHTLGVFHKDRNRYTEAESELRACLEIKKKNLGEEAGSLVTTLIELGKTLNSLDRKTEAEVLLKQALSISEKVYGPNAGWTISALNSLAALLDTQTRKYEINDLANRIKSITEATTGDTSLASTDNLVEVAYLKLDTEAYSEARELAEKALNIREKHLPADSPKIANALWCLAAIDRAEKKFDEGKRHFLRALEIAAKQKGWQSGSVAGLANDLAMMLESEGGHRLEESRKLLAQAAKTYIGSQDSNNSDSATILCNLGKSQFESKQFGASELTFKLRKRFLTSLADDKTIRNRARYNDKARFYASQADLLLRKIFQRNIASDSRYTELRPALDMLEQGDLQRAKSFIDNCLTNLNSNDLSKSSIAYAVAAEIYGQLGDLTQTKHHCDRACLLALESEESSGLQAADAIYYATSSLLRLDPKASLIPNLVLVKNIRQAKLGELHPLVAQAEVALSLRFGDLGYSESTIVGDAAKILTEKGKSLLPDGDTATAVTIPGKEDPSLLEVFGGPTGFKEFVFLNSMAVAYLGCRNDEGATLGTDMASLSAMIAQSTSDTEPGEALDRILDVVSFFVAEGDYKSANEFFESANKIVSNNPRLEVNQVADFNITAGKFCFEKGDYSKAQDYLLAFYNKEEKNPSVNVIDLGDACELLSACNFHLSKLERAESFARKSLDLYQKSKNDTYRTRGALVLLGQIAERRLQITEAKDYYVKSTTIPEQQSDEDDTMDLADAYAGLARCELKTGDVQSARQHLVKSSKYLNTLSAKSAILELVECYNAIARLDAYQNQWALSLQYRGQARDTLKNYLSEVFPQLSFSEQHAYVDRARQELAASLALCRNDDELDDFYSSVLECRGMLINSLHLQSRLERRAAEYYETLIPSLKQLSKIRTRLVDLSSLKTWNNEQLNECEGLISQKEAIERRLNAEIGTKFFTADSSGLGSLRSSLKEDESFIDVYTFTPLNESEPFYHAVIVLPEGKAKMVRLGAVEATNKLIKRWREACIKDANTRTLTADDDQNESTRQTVDDVNQLWKQLTNQLWFEIAQAIPKKTTKVWIAEDGQLARIPWMRMPLANTKGPRILVSLVNNYREVIAAKQLSDADAQSSSESSARSLKDKVKESEFEKPKILIVGGIDFQNQNLTLKKTVEEVSSIAKLATEQQLDVMVLDSDKPTKLTVVQSFPGSKYVHLATHGFAPDDSEMALFSTRLIGQAGTPRLSTRAANNIGAIRNPLLQSGLLLAPDTSTSARADRLTAEELLACDLSSCNMAVLSACDTGRGVEVSGQGVLGLRTALMAAGARSIVISLWPVPDDATSALMTEFYKQLWSSEKKTKLEALQAAQAIIANDPKHKQWKSPWYWAGWALIGEGW